MSKAVKSVGRAVSRVVKGSVNAWKKLAKSKVGRIVITAAAIYFGGAALAGAFGSSAAGGSFLSGMGTGVANAASSLSTAWSSALSGNFGAAGSSLSAGFQGTTTALQAANAGAATTAAMGGAQGIAGTGAGGVTQSAVGSTMGGAGGLSMPGAATGGVGSQLAAINTGVGAGAGATGATAGSGLAQGMIGAAKIQAGTALIGGAMQGAGQQKALEDERAYIEQQRAAQEARYRSSVDEFSRCAQAGAVEGGDGQTPPRAAFDPVAEARAIGDRYRADFNARNPQRGLIARGMQTPQPMTNNNFPVYNPAYYRG
jgi:hypothetical protein